MDYSMSIDINLRNLKEHHHIFDKNRLDDYVGYGVKFVNMRKTLIIRSPFTFNNLTDVIYQLKFLDARTKQLIKVV